MSQKNILLIGVGGTGCEVVRDLKKKLHVEWRTRGAKDKQIPDVFEFKENTGREMISRIATLSVDTNKRDLAGEGKRDQWDSLGEDIVLTGREQVLIDSSSVMTVAQDLDRYPGVSPWLRREDERDFLKNITTGLEPGAGCNQLRRLGRLALASGSNVANLLTGVSGRLEKLCDNDGQVEVDIHVAGSIATGTGGGTMLDIVAQLQAFLSRQPWDYKLYIHAFATSADVGEVNTGRFYINQYAALKEYNAFNRSSYKPWDINNPPEPKRLSIKPVDADPEDTSHYDLKQTFNSLFLVTETTDRGTRTTLSQQIGNTAELLFQLAVRQLGDVPNSIRQALSNEDNAETTDEGFTGARSMKFASYGVHRIAIPETKIRQRLSSSISLQFILQFLHNNWVKTFLDDPLAFNVTAFIADTVNAFEVHKSDIWLDRPTGDTKYPEEVKFKAYQQDWRLKLEEIQQETRKTGKYDEMQQWVTVFNKEAELYWNEGFRVLGDQGGVERYFSYHGSPVELEKRAARVANHIEAILLEGVENGLGNYTVHNLPEMVDTLITRLEEEAAVFNKRSGGYEKMSKASANKRNKIRDEIRKIGKIGYTLSGNAVRLFGQYQAESVVCYSNRTYERAARYGADFCSALLERLRSLRNEVGKFKQNILTLRDNLITELNDDIKKQSGIEDYVNWDEINGSIQKYFVTDRTKLDENRHSTFGKLKELRGDRMDFHAYNQTMTVDEKTNVVKGEFPDKIRSESLETSYGFHGAVVEQHPDFKPFFGRNIIQELYEAYREVTPPLEDIVQEWIMKSSPMVSFDKGQPRPNVPVPGPRRRRLLLLPKCQTAPDIFRKGLKDCATGMLGNNEGGIIIKDIPEERCINEISIMTVTFFFPARQASVVSALKRHYDDAMMRNDGAFIEYQCHSESRQFPSLMLPTRAEELENKLPSVLTATAMGLMQLPDELNDPVYFGIRRDGFSPIENRIETGLTLSQEVKDRVKLLGEQFSINLSTELATLYFDYLNIFLRESGDRVEELLGKFADSASLDQATEILDAYQKEVFLLAKRNEQDKKYNKFNAAISEARNSVIPELRENIY